MNAQTTSRSAVSTRPASAAAPVLSAAARSRLETELDELRTARAIHASEPIDICGDIADVAEFAARDMLLEQYDRRISRLDTLLTESGTEYATDIDEDGGTVRPGVVISLHFGTDGATERFLLGDIAERADAIEVITPSSPLGRALIGSRAGDRIECAAPRGTIQAEIVDVRPLTDLIAG